MQSVVAGSSDSEAGPWSQNRGRGLSSFRRRFAMSSIAFAIAKARRRGERPTVLEIGAGEGRLLLDLLHRYPDADLHGLNRTPWRNVSGESSMRRIARASGLFAKEELRALRLPTMHFHDASRLEFPDASFDLVVSQVAFFYIERKTDALREIWRVLKPGGQALIQLDSITPRAPAPLQHETPRFVVFDGDTPVPLGRVFAGLEASGYSVQFSRSKPRKGGRRVHFLLRMKKNRADPLPLDLTDDAARSHALVPPDDVPRGGKSWFRGHQSVYRVTATTPLGPVEPPEVPAATPAPRRAGAKLWTTASIAASLSLAALLTWCAIDDDPAHRQWIGSSPEPGRERATARSIADPGSDAIHGDGTIADDDDDDDDADGIPNAQDRDVDGDNRANDADDDVDGDGEPNGTDVDVDGDRRPNAEDEDVDGDGTGNRADLDVDGDSLPNGDSKEVDIDGDQVPDGIDSDADGDGVANADDLDIDGDGRANSVQSRWSDDIDGDGIANWLDFDADSDGLPDRIDPNPFGAV